MRRALLFLAVLAGCDGSSAAPAVDGGATVGGKRITFSNLTGAAGHALLWATFNDGEGAWQTLAGSGPTWSFKAKSGRYGLAFACALDGGGVSGEVVHATAAELPELSVDCGQPPPAMTRRLSGKITGLGADAVVDLQGGRGRETYLLGRIDPPATTYQAQLPPDTYDLAAVAYAGDRPRQALLRREVALTSDAVVDLDFAQAVTLAEQPLVLMGDTASAPGLAAGVTLFTGRGRFVWGDGSGQAPSSYAALPAAALAADDTLELEVFSVKGAEPAFTSRGVVKGFRQPRSLDVTLPPDFPVELSLPPGPSPRPRLAFTPYPGARFYQLVATQLEKGRVVVWLAIASAAWLGSQTSYQLPDFGAASGFRAELGLAPGMIDVEGDAVTSSRGFAESINDDPDTRDGSQLTYARKADRLASP